MMIGFPNHPRKDICKEITWIGRHGFDFVDIFMEEDRAVPEKINPAKVRALLKKYGLHATGHTAWYLPTGSPLKILRDAAVTEAVRYFKVFSKIGVKYVTIHANWPYGMFSEQEGINFQVETLRRLVKEAAKLGLTVMYEPIDGSKDNPKNIAKILKAVPKLMLHLDMGHSNLYGRKPHRMIERFHGRLVHVHLHDNDGTADQHRAMGGGNINWKKTVSTLKKYYDGTITLEIFADGKSKVLQSQRRLRKLWDRL